MSEIQKYWVRVCALEQVPVDKTISMSVNGQRLILARCGDEVRIYQGFCSHMLFPLAGSRIKDCVMQCGLHHSQFDIRDGSVVAWSTFPPILGPLLAEIRQRKVLRSYEARVTDGEVYVLWPADKPENIRIRV